MENGKKMSIERWESKYKPIVNPNAEDECSADRFETYGKDLDYVLNIVNTTPKKVWTLEDIDGRLIICAGYHIVNRMNYFITEVEWEDENIEVQYCDEDKLCFSTIEEGLEKIKEAYRKGDVVEGECADYLVDNYNECFDASVDPLIAIQAIQKFRQWDYKTEGEDAIECFGGTEAFSEDGFYGFILGKDVKSKQLPDGVRIGILKEDGGIELDAGITPAFSTVKYAHVSGYFKEDNELFENYLVAIGKWDGVTNDDHIFFWFSSEESIMGEHADFVITSYVNDTSIVSKEKSLSREEMINVMIIDDINSIRESFTHESVTFLDSVLRGNSGWKQYSELTDEEIVREFKDRNSENELDEIIQKITNSKK